MSIDVDAVYRQYGPMVLRRCRRLLRDETLAVDTMHDVFVQLLREKDRIEVRVMSALLRRIATHQCLNRLRTRRRHPEDVGSESHLIDTIASADDPAGRLEASWFLERLFDRAPASTRTIAVLLLLDRLTLEEVAQEVGMSVSGVRKRIRLLRAQVPALGEFA